MGEQRVSRRTDLVKTVMVSLIGEGDDMVSEPFEVTLLDISTTGIGFISDEQLLEDEMVMGTIEIWTKEKIDVMLKVIRCVENDDGSYNYGCIFVGLDGKEQSRIKIFQMFNEDE